MNGRKHGQASALTSRGHRQFCQFQRTGTRRNVQSPRCRRRERFTTSAVFRVNCSSFSIRRQATRRLAKRTRELLAPLDVGLDESWGLDHGTWSVLCHVFPDADVPVVQLCIDETKPASFHYKIGQRLRTLRHEGILVFGSGDIVHNLHAYAWGMHPAEPYDWALRFEAKARELIWPVITSR